MSSVLTSGRLPELSPRDILLSTLGNSFVWQFGWAWRRIINGSLSERRDVASRSLSSSAVIQYSKFTSPVMEERGRLSDLQRAHSRKGQWHLGGHKTEIRAESPRWEMGERA